MSELTDAVTSAAQETPVATPEIDIARGPLVNWTAEQRSEYRKTGEPPKPPEPKTETTAVSADKPQSEIAPAPEAGKDKPQGSAEKKHLTGEQRKAQLRAAVEQEWEKPEPDLDKIARFTTTIDRIDAGQRRKTETAPVAPRSQAQAQQPQQVQAANYAEWQEKFIDEGASPWLEQWANAHPGKSYESATAAMAAYMRSMERQFEQHEQATRQVESHIAEAKQKYGADFDAIIEPTAGVINQSLPPEIRQALALSDIAPEILLEIGRDPEGVDNLIRAAQKGTIVAIRHLAMIEASIKAKATTPPEAAAPQKPPAKQETRAPKPPAEVGGRGSTPPDALEAAAQAGDYRAFKAEANRRFSAR